MNDRVFDRVKKIYSINYKNSSIIESMKDTFAKFADSDTYATALLEKADESVVLNTFFTIFQLQRLNLEYGKDYVITPYCINSVCKDKNNTYFYNKDENSLKFVPQIQMLPNAYIKVLEEDYLKNPNLNGVEKEAVDNIIRLYGTKDKYLYSTNDNVKKEIYQDIGDYSDTIKFERNIGLGKFNQFPMRNKEIMIWKKLIRKNLVYNKTTNLKDDANCNRRLKAVYNLDQAYLICKDNRYIYKYVDNEVDIKDNLQVKEVASVLKSRKISMRKEMFLHP